MIRRGTTPSNPRGARNNTRERAMMIRRGTTPSNPRGARNNTRERARDTPIRINLLDPR